MLLPTMNYLISNQLSNKITLLHNVSKIRTKRALPDPFTASESYLTELLHHIMACLYYDVLYFEIGPLLEENVSC